MDFFLAKQPIFDRQQRVFGYDIMHKAYSKRPNLVNADEITLEVINTLLLVTGLDTLTRGKKAFIGFTKTLLENETAILLPPESIGIEINSKDLNEKVFSACQALKKKEYTLALKNFNGQKECLPFVEVFDIAKICFEKTDAKQREEIFNNCKNEKIHFLAENVETRDSLNQALNLGYSYFQGSVFSKPEVISGRDIISFKPTYLLLLHEVFQSDIDFDKVEKYIKQDVSLSYKLLKYINSLKFGFRTEIHSIKQAIVILGRKGLVQWISLVALKSLSNNKPEELFFSAIYRAKFCELIALNTHLREQSSDLFLMGMFSLIDAILDQPLNQVLNDLPLSMEIKEALLGEKNPYSRVYDLILNYEKGNWEQVATDALLLNLKENQLVYFYLDSLKYADTVQLAQAG